MQKRLLIIEDTKTIATVIERIGLSLGYQVTIAQSFAEVKALVEDGQKFFVATVDYCLPDAPTGEVIPYVLQNEIPSIVMTGHMDDNTHKKILNLPIIDYITKENSQAFHYLLRVLKGQLVNNKLGVLVVDDSLTARNHVEQLLARRNFKVYKAEGAHKALEILDKHDDIQMIITDQEMPVMDGIALIQQVRRKYPKRDLIVIGLSGANKNFQSARFIKSGADDFLRKPFCPEEFYCRLMQNIEKVKYIEEIKGAANSDYLTGLFNRRYFIEQATEVINGFEHTLNSAVFAGLQVDDFKKINDLYGYNAGDQVLIKLSELLKIHFKSDLIARLGGAEFGLLLSSASVHDIEEKIQALQAQISKILIKVDGHSFSFSVSLGGEVIENKSPIRELFIQVNETLQQAFKDGGNKCIINGFIDLS